ncbi:hypothetical protein BGZ70_006451, partial [Mortierella alpina]
MVTHWKRLIPQLIKKVKEENFEWVSGAEGVNFFGALDEKGVSNVHDPVSVFFILNSKLSPESQFKFVPMSGYTEQFCNIPEAILMAVLLRQRNDDIGKTTRTSLVAIFGNSTDAITWCHTNPGDIANRLFCHSKSSYRNGIGLGSSVLELNNAESAAFLRLSREIDLATRVDEQYKRNLERIKP